MDTTDLRDIYRDTTGKCTMVSDDVHEPHYTIDYVIWLENMVLNQINKEAIALLKQCFGPKIQWTNCSVQYPNAYRSSEHWDGLRSDDIIFRTGNDDKYIGTFYQGILDGENFNDFADESGAVIPNVVEWCYL